MKKSVLMILLAAGLTAEASVREGTFNKTLTAGETELTLAGTGSLSRWFIKGCDMALFTEKETAAKDVLNDIPRALEFYYHVRISSDQFATAAWDTMEKNFSRKELEEQKSAIDKLHKLYRDVQKGDRYRLVYEPGAGTTLYLNNQKLGTVEGTKFAEIYFSVWLGKVPIDRHLKADLTKGLK